MASSSFKKIIGSKRVKTGETSISYVSKRKIQCKASDTITTPEFVGIFDDILTMSACLSAYLPTCPPSCCRYHVKLIVNAFVFELLFLEEK